MALLRGCLARSHAKRSSEVGVANNYLGETHLCGVKVALAGLELYMSSSKKCKCSPGKPLC